ncbi:hypothetical protein [Janthinobacterium sp.]|uniref:hypothetical protein n=1 Tax=Janthinobacterium sp. TaxID=1871054 RepID=UPI00293D4AA5|nr:hypothetical protein [Janthinobacterium sp.]
MAAENPPFLPPDTGPAGGWYPPEDDPDLGSYCFTEGTESIDTTLTKKQDKELNPEKYMLIHPVYFEVKNESDAASFLFELLTNLQYVDQMAHLLPHGDMPDGTPVYTSTDQIPHDVSLSSFTHAYLSGLRVNGVSLMGKFWLKCHKKFTEFKLDPVFLLWLKGKDTSKRVTLDRMDMTGTERYSVGFFVNALAEQKLLENFNYQLRSALESSTHDEVPEFQCDILTMYNGKDPTRVIRMMTNTRANVGSLQKHTSALLGKPSIHLTFISYKVWDGLNEEKKTAYRGMQQQFASNVCALVLSGLRDPSLDVNACMPSRQVPEPGKISILNWVKATKSSDKTNLFSKVSLSPNGGIELWHFKSHVKEAREWVKLALPAIAMLSGIAFGDERERAEVMFLNPDKVWKQLDEGRKVDSIPSQRSIFMDFQPPTTSVQSKRGVRNNKRQPRVPMKGEKMQLQFDMELVKRNQERLNQTRTMAARPMAAGTATFSAAVAANVFGDAQVAQSGSRRSKAKLKAAQTESSLTIQHSLKIDPDVMLAAAALAAAKTAMAIGQATIAKLPPTAFEKLTHGTHNAPSYASRAAMHQPPRQLFQPATDTMFTMTQLKSPNRGRGRGGGLDRPGVRNFGTQPMAIGGIGSGSHQTENSISFDIAKRSRAIRLETSKKEKPPTK